MCMTIQLGNNVPRNSEEAYMTLPIPAPSPLPTVAGVQNCVFLFCFYL